jgi:hypothetical protein
MIEKLREIYPHSIRSCHSRGPDQRVLREFRCITYAFQLHTLREFFEIRARWRITFDDDRLVTAIVDELLVEKSRHEAVDGDLVIYLTDTGIIHAGIVSGQSVCSKWGESFIWQHGLFEIPAEFGSKVRYFAALPPEVTLRRFRVYAARLIREYRTATRQHMNREET